MLDKVKHSFPTKDEVIKQINMVMMQERKVKYEQYVERFTAMPDKDKITLCKQDWLMIFGTPTGYTNSITGARTYTNDRR
jgi:hypothetical protein